MLGDQQPARPGTNARPYGCAQAGRLHAHAATSGRKETTVADRRRLERGRRARSRREVQPPSARGERVDAVAARGQPVADESLAPERRPSKRENATTRPVCGARPCDWARRGSRTSPVPEQAERAEQPLTTRRGRSPRRRTSHTRQRLGEVARRVAHSARERRTPGGGMRDAAGEALRRTPSTVWICAPAGAATIRTARKTAMASARRMAPLSPSRRTSRAAPPAPRADALRSAPRSRARRSATSAAADRGRPR